MVEVVNLYHMCKTFGQLPVSGGLLDQPARLMYVFEGISAAEAEKAIKDNGKKKG